MELTHASFFSGVGGLDLGIERAGWRTVSFSEIDPYASAVLAERWPGVPNLGDIVTLADRWRVGQPAESAGVEQQRDASGIGREGIEGGAWCGASLWSGGFPCQDLSVAGKRAGLAGARSGLAFAFLDLVERHRPPAILLENVPGLLSSHKGRDFGALLGRLAELRYWWAYRILDAQYFGVPQRRRRVFICALHAGAGFGADSAAAVLSVGSRCDGHSATGDATGAGTAQGIIGSLDTALGHHGAGWPAQSVAAGHVIADGQHIARSVLARQERNNDHTQQDYVIGPPSDPGGVRAADGLAGRLDDSAVAHAVSASQGHHGHSSPRGDGSELLPLGLDSHRYRCCGNGVVAPVAEWVGERLRWAVEAA